MATRGTATATNSSATKTLLFEWVLKPKSQNVTKKESTISWTISIQSTTHEYITSLPADERPVWEIKNLNTGATQTNTLNKDIEATPMHRPEEFTAIAAGVTVIKHDKEGEGNLNLSFSIPKFEVEGTATARLTPLEIHSTLTVADGVLGEAQTIKINRTVTAGFSHKLTYSLIYSGDVQGYIIGSATTTNTNMNPSWTPPLSLASYAPDSTTIAIDLTLTTYYEDDEVERKLMGRPWTTRVWYTIPESFKPSLTLFVDEATDCLIRYGNYVQHITTLAVELLPYIAANSEIATYRTVVDGINYTTKRFTSQPLRTAGTVTVHATVTDGRGRQATASETLTVIPYIRPAIKILRVGRCNEDGSTNEKGEYVRVTFSASVTPLNHKNSAKYVLRYKKSTDEKYTAEVFSQYNNIYEVNNHSFIFKADTGSSYDVELRVTDDHYTSTRVTSASTAFTLIHWAADGTSIAFGKVAEEPNLFDVGLPARFNDPVHGRVLGLDNLPSIPSHSDANAYMTTGGYAVYTNDVAASIANLPIPYAGRLFVSASTGEGERVTSWSYIRQTFIPYSLRFGVYERDITRDSTNVWTYYDWVQTSGGAQTVLWSGEDDVTGTINLSDKISRQLNGIVLVFARYDASGSPFNHQTFFVSKGDVKRAPGVGRNFALTSFNYSAVGNKYLYIRDDQITGHADNINEGTGESGIHYNNGAFKLQAVIGV